MRRLLPIAVSILCAAALLAEAEQARHNTLFENGDWVSGKVGLARGVMGAVAFLATRPALSRNRLDLGAWFGFQEVVYREPLDLDEVAFDFQLSDGAALTFLYGGDERGFDGMRFVRSAEIPTAALRVAPDGGFVTLEPFITPPLGDGWHRLRARFDPAEVELSLDGVWFANRPPPAARSQRFGFRGSMAPARIDNVAIRTRDGRVVVDSFRNRRGQLSSLALALALVIALNGLAFVLSRRAPGRATARLIALNCTLLAGGAVYLAVDFYRLSAIYPSESRVDWHGYVSNIESQDEVVRRLDARYPRAVPDGVTRILFLGSSQTWGAGAARIEDVFAARIEERLNRETGRKFEVLNGGISGSMSTWQRNLYEQDWIRFGPRLVVVNLATNEGDANVFRADLHRIAAFNRARGIRTLFVLEANAPEHGPLYPHQVMREVAREESIPLVDLHGYLAERRDSGFLFWDFVHLTSFGQRLAADALYPAIAELVR